MPPASWVAFWSGLGGFLFGCLAKACWQNAVEGAQIWAGLVDYPKSNPFYLYQIKAWTLLHQIPALFLKWGASEKILSIFLSGVMGMISFQALALSVFAFSHRKNIAILSAFFLSFAGLYSHGTVYPVSLMGIPATYGVIGLSWMALCVSLLALKQEKIGGLLLGLAPAIHVSLGFLVWLVIGIASCWHFSEEKKSENIWPKWFFCGAILSVLCFLIHDAFVKSVIPNPPAIDPQIYSAFIRFWDGHRKPVSLFSEDIAINISLLTIAGLWLFFFRRDLLGNSVFLLKSVCVSALLGILFAVLSWIPPENFPILFERMMLPRILCLNILLSGSILLGLASRYAENWYGKIFWISLLGVILLLRLFHIAGILTLITLWIFAGSLFLLRLSKKIFLDEAPSSKWMSMLHRVGLILLGLTLVPHTLQLVKFPEIWNERMGVRTGDVFFEKVAQDKRILLLAAPLTSIQLYTRRAVLMDIGALDSITYIPEAGRESNQILKDIYGLDLLHPTENPPNTAKKELWENRSQEEWTQLSKKYHFSQILTEADWQLRLPKAAENSQFLLYQIPDVS